MNQLLAVLARLPREVEYTFVKIILDALPPMLEVATWDNRAADDEILTAFNKGTYGVVDRLLLKREKTLFQLPETERDKARAQLDPVRRSLIHLLLAEALAKTKEPGDCWIGIRWVDPGRLGRPSEPCPISGPGVVIDVWKLGRGRRAHRLFVKGVAAGPPPWGDPRIPWVDPVALGRVLLSLLRKYCRPLFRLPVGHEWRTKRASSPWRTLTLRVIPQLYDYLRPFYSVRRYTAKGEVSPGKYPRALLRDIRDVIAGERPDLAGDLTEDQVRAAIRRHLESAPSDRPLGRAMFQVRPKSAPSKHTTRPK